MKPKLEILREQIGYSFLIREFGKEAFKAPYHFHPEYELTLILKGKGTRYTGNILAPFNDGDMILLGANCPHCWKLASKQEQANCIVIQFSESFLGEQFFLTAELKNIRRLLEKSIYGLKFKRSIRNLVVPKLISLPKEKDPFKRLFAFLEILYLLSEPRVSVALEQKPVDKQAPAESGRIKSVMGYIVDNFRNKISLSKAAEVANMSPNALCRYFKKFTRKTFTEMVIEYRLNYAAQQLVQTSNSVSSVCYESGFNDISYFNKAFKSKMRLNPLHYRKKFLIDVFD